MQRQTGEIPAALADAAECPEELRYLWEYFVSLGLRRTGNGYSPNAVSNAEIMAWARLHHVRLTALEVEALDELERIYLEHCAARAIEKAAAKR